MHWGKVLLFSFIFLILFLLGAIFVNPLTDGIENNVLRIVVKELLRIGFTIGFLWLFVQLALKKTNAYFRIHKWAKKDLIWILVSLVMPITVISFYVFTKMVAFESFELGLSFIVISFITACSAGIIEELLFRGYLLKLIEDKWGAVIAVSITSILFAALHLLTVNGLKLIDMLLILIAGSLVGILFSLIVYRTGNVWNAVTVHVGWNFFMNPQMVRFALVAEKDDPSFILLRFHSDSVWITGGAFGIEAALPALVLYGLMITGLVFYHRK